MIPTRNRPDLLVACLEALAANTWSEHVEVIVVDDGSDIPLDSRIAPSGLRVTVTRCRGLGPGAARNVGIARARAGIVLFTDDDTVPCKAWIEVAVSYLDSHPDCVGVDGPVRSPRWDPLTEVSIETDAPDHYWTCNVAYRRQTLVDLGGFRSDVFRFAHGEDRDLALRALSHGRIGFDDRMEIVHTPRRLALKEVYSRGRWAREALILYALHPHLTREFTGPARLSLIWGASTFLRAEIRARNRFSPQRIGRALVMSLMAVAVTTATVVTTSSASVLRRRYGGAGGTLGQEFECEH